MIASVALCLTKLSRDKKAEVALLSEDDYIGKLEELSGENSQQGGDSDTYDGGSTTVIVESEAKSPIFGIVLIAVALIYLIVLSY